ncbi:cAMP-specific 3',5'-cyclic phosphodiesterase 7B [Armadillidium nasatum]|uniref:Phosphodiesterase n=1 Tax=Armadillidium nasatum TaxID=96803 RepID=A0A5N5SUC2_9CRUS|nr:cAMP-specific 3',5'-cyclic phosphodiesterase 7B [Armadillidium nasatum]
MNLFILAYILDTRIGRIYLLCVRYWTLDINTLDTVVSLESSSMGEGRTPLRESLSEGGGVGGAGTATAVVGGMSNSSSSSGSGSLRQPESRSLFVPRISSFSGGQDAEERLLSRAFVGRRALTSSSSNASASYLRPRFFTLHRRKRRRPPTRALVKEAAVLDDLYNGPTQCVLQRVSLWDFNAFVLDSVCGGRPVTNLCIDQYLTPFEKLAAIIASVCHDLDHPGVNQPFLIATDNHLAALYNNASVLENHHWRCAMGCLWECGLLEKWSSSEVEELQEVIKSLILATDITRQNEFLTRFKMYQDTETMDMTKPECRYFSLQIALKCADICNPCRPWETSRQWSQKICDEFYRQGDYERQLRLPVTSMCDRYTNSVANIQAGFIKFVVSPLFESWDRWLGTPLSKEMVKHLNTNLQRWESVLNEEQNKDSENVSSDKFDVEVVPSRDSSGRPSIKEDPCPITGRRYSLPVNMPSLLPRTMIRRESLTGGDGAPPLVFETLKMGGNIVDSVVSVGVSGEETTLPSPSIANMSDMNRPRRMTMHSITISRTQALRRQSLPPLWDSFSIPSRIPLQPLPPTPLQEELPPMELESGDDEKVPLLKKNGSGCAGGSSEGNSKTGNNDNNESTTSRNGHSSKECAGNTGSTPSPLHRHSSERRTSATRNVSLDLPEEGDKENVAPVGERGERPPPQTILKTRLWRSLNHEDDPLDSQFQHPLIRGPKGIYKQNNRMGRRGSAPLLKHDDMRSTLRANYDRPMHELPKRRGSAPSHHLAAQLGPDCLNKGAYGTSSVLSLLSGGGGVGGASCGHGGGGNNAGGFVGKNYNNNSNDGYGDGTGGLTFCSGGISYGVGRRVLGGGPLRGGGEASLSQTASGGSDILSLLSQERVLQQSNQLLTQTQQKGSFPGERNNMGCLRLSQRRGSAPWDGQRTDLQAFWANQSSKHSETSSKRQYSDGAGSLQLEFMPSDIQGNYCGGGGVTPGSLEFRRGSVGFELMAGLWRLRMESQGSSLCSNESVRISSSGDGTPGTPGVPSGLNPSLFQGPPLMPGPITRRGSLPTDIIIGGDFDRWGGLDDS